MKRYRRLRCHRNWNAIMRTGRKAGSREKLNSNAPLEKVEVVAVAKLREHVTVDEESTKSYVKAQYMTKIELAADTSTSVVHSPLFLEPATSCHEPHTTGAGGWKARQSTCLVGEVLSCLLQFHFPSEMRMERSWRCKAQSLGLIICR